MVMKEKVVITVRKLEKLETTAAKWGTPLVRHHIG